MTITASLFGSLGSILVSFALAKILFDGLWTPMISLPLVITVSLGLITMLMCWISTGKLFGRKTIELVMPFS